MFGSPNSKLRDVTAQLVGWHSGSAGVDFHWPGFITFCSTATTAVRGQNPSGKKESSSMYNGGVLFLIVCWDWKRTK
jgi:hypothetical protein